jgi:hypothetical protein
LYPHDLDSGSFLLTRVPQRRKRLRRRRKKASVELSGEKGHRDEHSLPPKYHHVDTLCS